MTTPSKLVMVVDDDAPLRESVCELLEEDGYRVLAAESGVAALERLRSAAPKPDVILLDLMMPVMNGWQFREAQLRDPQLAGIPVVVMTANRDLRGIPAEEVILKPVKLGKLLDVVRRHAGGDAPSAGANPAAALDTRERDVLAGGGEMGALMRDVDWRHTPVGAVSSWPQSLRTAVSILLDSKFGMYIAWGPELTQFYNDAYRPILGSTKHPSFGRSTREVFPEIWPTIGPLFDDVMHGKAVGFDDLMLALDRHGFLEECYFTFSYSPIRDEVGVGGVLVTVTETTNRVVVERRLRVLRDLASSAAQVKDEASAWSSAAQILNASPADVPFALLYRIDGDGSRLRRADGAPLSANLAPDPLDVQAGSSSGWPIAEVLASGTPQLVENVRARFGDHAGSSWPESIEQALVLPVMRPGASRAFGVLVAAISPRRPLDDDYRSFLVLAADHLATAIANARTYEEERLRFGELRSLILNVPGAVFRCEANAPWRFLYMSEPVADLTGYPASVFLEGAKDWASLIHPDDLDFVERGAQAAAGDHQPHNLEYRIVRADGAVRWVVDRGRAIYDRDGAVEAWDGVVFDITERRLETAAREGAERFRFIAETMPQKVFTAKPTGDVDYFNRQWMELTGLSFEQIRDWGWTQFVHPDDVDENVRRWRQSIDSGEPFELEHRFRAADGTYRWHISRAHPVRDADGTITMWLGSNTDIDAVKRAEEKTISELQRTIRFSEVFVGILGHDLRNPLSAITAAANLLEIRADSEAIAKPVSRIVLSADRMDRMISQLLDFTQIRLGRGIPLAPTRVDLAAVARSIVEEIQPVHHREIELACSGDVVGTWDRDRLSQLLSNLVGNACQHGAPGASIKIELDGTSGARVQLTVVNRGAIPASLVMAMFEPLHSDRPERRNGSSGLGLGLYITQQIAVAHGGSIRVESSEQAGTRFIVELPRHGSGGAGRALDIEGFAAARESK